MTTGQLTTEQSQTVLDIVAKLSSQQHITRKIGEEKLNHAISTNVDQHVIERLLTSIKDLVKQQDQHQLLGGLIGAKALLKHKGDQELLNTLYDICEANLEHQELRIRIAIGELLACIAQVEGAESYERMAPALLSSVQRNFDRDQVDASAELNNDQQNETGAAYEDYVPSKRNVPLAGSPTSCDSPMIGQQPSLLSSLVDRTYQEAHTGQGDYRHCSEGWKALETSFRALYGMLQMLGPDVQPFISEELWEMVGKALLHPNRFIREVGHLVLGALVTAGGEVRLQQYGEQVARQLLDGLSDNWSQVRYAASVATRQTFSVVKDNNELRGTIQHILLPAMCLNRYYVAEGVRVYSQDTWKQCMGTGGRDAVAECIDPVVSYYIMQSKANNHAVREAACACIAELMLKVDHNVVRPYVPRLLQGLINCFKDASWPVRDAACTATGRAVTAFPAECEASLNELYELWIAHLQDNIPSVRENSAIALGQVATAYPSTAIPKLTQVLRDTLTAAKNQPPDSQNFSQYTSTTQFGVPAPIGSRRKMDPARVTDQTMFSCGSLAPKLARGGGCIDHGFTRAKEPWEASEGAVFLLTELAGMLEAGVLSEMMGLLVELVRMDHYAQANKVQESVWRCVPVIAEKVGKRTFKQYLQELIDPMFQTLKHGTALSSCAAGKCIGSIRDMLGPSIFAGRLAPDQQQCMAEHANVPLPGGKWRNVQYSAYP